MSSATPSPTSPLPNPVVVEDFIRFLSEPDVAVAVAVIKALTGVIHRSTATTMMQMESELQSAAHQLKHCQVMPHTKQTKEEQQKAIKLATRYQNSIATTAGCQLFLRYVTRCFLEFDDFELCKSQLIDRGKLFAETSLTSRKRIADIGHRFIRDGMRVLTHGTSRVVIALLIEAAKTTNFSVLITEGRRHESGVQTAMKLAEVGIPTTLILDAAVGYYMEQVDMVIVGAEGVVENGGIVNSIGTFSTAIVAQTMRKPFYVAAESYKFARLYPLNQKDVPQKTSQHLFTMGCDQCNVPALLKKQQDSSKWAELIELDQISLDYTPPKFISLIFTDLGVLTPSAVSDELIKLYQ